MPCTILYLYLEDEAKQKLMSFYCRHVMWHFYDPWHFLINIVTRLLLLLLIFFIQVDIENMIWLVAIGTNTCMFQNRRSPGSKKLKTDVLGASNAIWLTRVRVACPSTCWRTAYKYSRTTVLGAVGSSSRKAIWFNTSGVFTKANCQTLINK